MEEACRELETRGLLKRLRQDHSARIIAHVRELIGGWIPPDLAAFYRERVDQVADFLAIAPVWNDHVGWRTEDRIVTQLLHVQAVPILSDGCGSLFGVDLSERGASAVYFFDHEDGFSRPHWAAGSSLGNFLLLMGDHDRAYDEQWPTDWWLSVDPDIARCPRAPPLWAA